MSDALKIKAKAARLGYVCCGIIPAAVFLEYEEFLTKRAEASPDSMKIYGPLYDFIRPPAEVKSIIVALRSITKYRVPAGLDGRVGKFYMFDNRVEYSRDYRSRREFEAYLGLLGLGIVKFTVPSRWAAVKAGLGRFGRNNCVYHPEHGSNVKIEAYAVDMELPYDDPPDDIYLDGCAESCGKCVAACPTGALSKSYTMDASKCVTSLTTNAGEEVAAELLPLIGQWVYGCDACQDACPHNKNVYTETEDYPLLSEYEEYLKPENVVEMDEKTYLNVIYPRFWYAGKDGSRLWKLNALNAMINSGDVKYDKYIEKCRSSEDSQIRALAMSAPAGAKGKERET